MCFSRTLSLAASVLLFGLLVFGLLGLAQAKQSPPTVGLDPAIVQEESFVSRDCKEGDWGLLDTAEAKSLLSDYDFDPFNPGQCTTVDVKWMPSAQIVRLKAVTVSVDDFREITLLRASPDSRLWLIPIEKGMVGNPNTPDDPHHLAAFNDLLRAARVRVNDDNVAEVSDLYQFVVGMEMKPGPPTTIQEALSRNDISGLVEHKDGFIDFTHREPHGDRWTGSYMVWEFRYSTSGQVARLVDIERKTLKEYGK
jgi:hypothetical protein